MNNITYELKTLELETIKNLKNSKANNTIRAYESDFRDFSLFCSKNGLKNLPTEPRILSIYLTHLAKSFKYSTLKRRIASIKVVHKIKGHYLDTKHPVIMENLLGIKRINGSYQTPKKPLLINSLKLIIKAIDQKEKKELKKIRNKSLILLGFAGGFRRSELVNVEYEDLELVEEGLKIFIKRSKTDQAGEGSLKAIPYFNNREYCPVTKLKDWIKYANIKKGKIYNISDKSVSLIIKKYALLAELNPNLYGGHSLRSGFATSAAESGVEERNIMAMTGHKTSQMVRRYIHEANLFKNNALNKMKI
ncbi:MAG: integrase [Flavobacteriales bacterium TMED235]|nr:MAG: integrase [Flavobacteriales bacterium TMED235]|tara:strand:+ start:229 stop:1146 length:918 start_codon:yes stop_codon:yes gene_type:complete